jgi:outer membrane protein insertion porin family
LPYLPIHKVAQQGSTIQKQDPNYNKLRINGIGVTLGKRLNWPDNYFQLNYSLNVDHYDLDNYNGYLILITVHHTTSS